MKTSIFGELAIIPYFILAIISSNLKHHNYRVRERVGNLNISARQITKVRRRWHWTVFKSDQDRLPVELIRCNFDEIYVY